MVSVEHTFFSYQAHEVCSYQILVLVRPLSNSNMSKRKTETDDSAILVMLFGRVELDVFLRIWRTISEDLYIKATPLGERMVLQYKSVQYDLFNCTYHTAQTQTL